MPVYAIVVGTRVPSCHLVMENDDITTLRKEQYPNSISYDSVLCCSTENESMSDVQNLIKGEGRGV